MAWEKTFTADEWGELQTAPFAAFVSVAAADGKVDEKELRAFAESVQVGPYLQEGLLSEVLSSLLRPGFESAARGRLPETLGDILNSMRSVAKLLNEKVDGDEGEAFKRGLVGIALNVGEASGGGFLGRGDKLSNEERVMIGALAEALSLSLSE